MRRDALSNLHRLDWFCKFFRVRWQWQNRAGSRAFFLKGAIMAPHQAMRWIRNNSTMHSPPCLKLWAKISSMKLWLLWYIDKEQYLLDQTLICLPLKGAFLALPFSSCSVWWQRWPVSLSSVKWWLKERKIKKQKKLIVPRQKICGWYCRKGDSTFLQAAVRRSPL